MRNSGKTYRQVLRSLLHASEGKSNVIYISNSRPARSTSFNMAAHCSEFILCAHIKKNKIEFNCLDVKTAVLFVTSDEYKHMKDTRFKGFEYLITSDIN